MPPDGPRSPTRTRIRATSSRAATPTQRAVALDPRLPGAHMGLGHVLKTLGDQPGALRAYRAAIAAKPDFGEVYWSMANLKVFRFEDAEIAAMEEQLEAWRPYGSAGDPFPLRARQGPRGQGRLRPRLALLRHRQPEAAPASFPRSGGLRGAPRRDRRSLQSRVPRTACRARDSNRPRRSSSWVCLDRARR